VTTGAGKGEPLEVGVEVQGQQTVLAGDLLGDEGKGGRIDDDAGELNALLPEAGAQNVS